MEMTASSGLSAKAGLSYEVDLFGKLARQTEAKRWEALATEQDLQATAQKLNWHHGEAILAVGLL